jgi:hypothetical protein
MGTITIEPSFEALTVRAAISFAKLLEHHFDDIALERYGPGPPECPCQKRADSAQRITELCRKLVGELQRCERYETICQNIENDADEER